MPLSDLTVSRRIGYGSKVVRILDCRKNVLKQSLEA